MLIRMLTSASVTVILVSLIFPFVKIFISDSQASSKQKVSFVASMLADAALQSLTD